MLRRIGNTCICIIFICAAIYAFLYCIGGREKITLYFSNNEIDEVELQEIYRGIDKEKYYFKNISPEEQKAYAEIYYILTNFDSEKEVSVQTKDQFNKVLTCVLNDYPEIFYINGYAYNLSRKNKIVVSPDYTCSKEEAIQKMALIDNYSQLCLSGCPETGDQYIILKYLYEYIIQHTNYNAISTDNQSMCSVMINGVSVCQGYAKALQYLLSKKGIESIFVVGKTSKGINHAWLEVNINGEWYCCDPTWGDTKFNSGCIEENSVNYDYLCTSTDEFTITHLVDNVLDVPMCYSMKDNYYVREGYYIDSYDRDKVIDLYNKACEKGKNNFFFKCADKDVYETAGRDLINDEGIFEIITDESIQVSYGEYEKQRAYIFWF